MDEVILTRNVSKYYGKVRAVDGISLRVRKGEIYGCIGLNGAGKTTMIRLLLGMIHPTTGASFVCGKQVHSGSHDLWKNIGYLVETPHSYRTSPSGKTSKSYGDCVLSPIQNPLMQ